MVKKKNVKSSIKGANNAFFRMDPTSDEGKLTSLSCEGLAGSGVRGDHPDNGEWMGLEGLQEMVHCDINDKLDEPTDRY